MCGRYVTKIEADREREWEFVGSRAVWRFPSFVSFNVAPTQAVPIVRAMNGEREVLLSRWGLIPFFANGVPLKASTINIRVENMTSAPSYRSAWSRGQRCLVLLNGFYEWHAEGNTKTPFYVTCADQPAFAFAGLWDVSRKPDGTEVLSCAHITMPANDLLRYVHNGGANPYRMPAILPREGIETWLTGTADDALALLRPYPADCMMAWPVSRRVNSPKNDDAELVGKIG